MQDEHGKYIFERNQKQAGLLSSIVIVVYHVYHVYRGVFVFSWCLAGCSGDRTVQSSNGHLKREYQIIPLEFHPTRGENYNCNGSEQTKRNMMLTGSHAQHGSDSLRTCH